MVKLPAKNKDKTFSSEEWDIMQDAAGLDILKDLGPISKEEVNYYENLKNDPAHK